jgi:putative CocE/NonD family hydrolase
MTKTWICLLPLLLPLYAAGADRTRDWHELLAPPVYHAQLTMGVEEIRARDGVILRALIYRPDAPGKFPVFLINTPYDKMRPDYLAFAQYFAERGYAAVIADVRGRYDSEGENYLYGPHDGPDLFDIQSWAARQSWSSGKIGTTGGSYLGFVQLEGAMEGNPNYTCMTPMVSPDDHYDNVYPSGAFQLSNSVNLAWILGKRTNQNPDAVLDWDKVYRYLPLKDLDVKAMGLSAQFWSDWLKHLTRDDYWPGPGHRIAPGKNGAGKYHLIKVPSYNVSGWFDQVSQATLNNYMGMVQHGPADLRGKHKVMMGPWTHGISFGINRKQGDIEFPPHAAPDMRMKVQRWMDYWLKGIDNGILDEPPVEIYVMGADTWRLEKEWPLARTAYTNYYFHGGGRANSLLGDGILSTTPPAGEPEDRFVYNPENPAPTLGGNVSMKPASAGPYDQSSIERRDDILVYSTPPLAEDVEVTGPVHVELYAATDGTDTDFTGKLVDVWPSGYAEILLEGVIRGRYRESFEHAKLLTPGKVEKYYVDLWSTSNLFRKKHRIRVEISSSNFPKYDRNPNTGHPIGQDAELKTARQTIYHDAGRPSHIVLPVIPK